MFDNLTDKLERVIKKIKGYGLINEDNIGDILREVRLALLEADVNYQIVKEFTNKVKAKALGEEVRNSISPSDMFLKIIKDELLALLGNDKVDLNLDNKPSIIMLVGLQGSGKTTTVAKLGNYIRKEAKKKVLFIAADTYRPAATLQLNQLGKELKIEVFKEGNQPQAIVKKGLSYAEDNDYEVIIIDTAGRLHVDDELMVELKEINKEIKATEILLVIDSMMGQDALNVITGFNQQLPLTGVILTKLDSDTRGGVALSVKYLTSLPIKFIGVSEKVDGLMPFNPSRMVGRILGEGDLLTLIEKAEKVIDQQDAKEMNRKLRKGQFDFNDFLKQLKQIKKLGSFESILKMIPGMSKLGLNNINFDPKKINQLEAIILSMTNEERNNPSLLKASRKLRIAKGSGTSVQAINILLKQFEQMKKMMKMLNKGSFNFSD